MKVGDLIKIKDTELKNTNLPIDFTIYYEIEKIEYLIANIFRVKLKNNFFWIMCFDIDGWKYNE